MQNPITRPHVVGGGVGAVLMLAATFIGPWEGLYTHPYRDPVGVLTVCYGATAADNVDLSKSYTPAECKDMLAKDLPKYDNQLKSCLKPEVYDALPLHRHAAFISAVYNFGVGTWCHSAMVRDLNAGNTRQACDDLLLYDRAKGKELQGLENRRVAEREWCLRSD